MKYLTTVPVVRLLAAAASACTTFVLFSVVVSLSEVPAERAPAQAVQLAAAAVTP